MEAFGQGFFGRDSDKQFSMTIAIENKGINATVCELPHEMELSQIPEVGRARTRTLTLSHPSWAWRSL